VLRNGPAGFAEAALGAETGMATTLPIDTEESTGEGPAVVEADYRPSAEETFMNDRQLRYYRRKLLDWKESILLESQGTLVQLQTDSLREPDVTDRASTETDWSIELRTRDRQRKLISKIEAALRRIDEGEYGYCEVTGEPISLARLDARPIATMTVEAQERHERQEKVSRDE
jgi:DnaK suppressor protein